MGHSETVATISIQGNSILSGDLKQNAFAWDMRNARIFFFFLAVMVFNKECSIDPAACVGSCVEANVVDQRQVRGCQDPAHVVVKHGCAVDARERRPSARH